MSNESYDTVIIQEKNTMEVNPAKLTMTEFGLAAVIESTENEAEKIITVRGAITKKTGKFGKNSQLGLTPPPRIIQNILNFRNY